MNLGQCLHQLNEETIMAWNAALQPWEGPQDRDVPILHR